MRTRADHQPQEAEVVIGVNSDIEFHLVGVFGWILTLLLLLMFMTFLLRHFGDP